MCVNKAEHFFDNSQRSIPNQLSPIPCYFVVFLFRQSRKKCNNFQKKLLQLTSLKVLLSNNSFPSSCQKVRSLKQRWRCLYVHDQLLRTRERESCDQQSFSKSFPLHNILVNKECHIIEWIPPFSFQEKNRAEQSIHIKSDIPSNFHDSLSKKIPAQHTKSVLLVYMRVRSSHPRLPCDLIASGGNVSHWEFNTHLNQLSSD